MSSSHETISLATLLIQKCSSINCLLKARQIHARVITASPPIRKSTYLNNNLLAMYSRCGSLLYAHHVFDEMPQRTIVSYNALIAAYSRSRSNASTAFNLLTWLNLEGFVPNGPTFTSLLQISCFCKDVFLGSGLHAQIVKLEFLSDTLVQTSLLGMYSDCGDLESSKKVFGCIVYKDSMCWNTIIVGHMKNEKIVQGIYFYGEMVNSGAFPTQFTYSMVLNGCSKLQLYEIGKLIHAHIIVSGIPTDLPMLNALLNMYSTCADSKLAMRVFEDIRTPDLVSWNSNIAGNKDDEKSTIELFIRFCNVSAVKPDDYTFATVISATRRLPAFIYGKPLHSQVIKAGFDMNVYVGSTLVSTYFENGDSESAKKLESLIPDKDVVFWTEMITGYAKMGDGENAINCFCEISKWHKIDSFSLSVSLSVCSDLVAKNQGEMIHCQAVKLGYDLEMTVCGSLIDMYAKIGDLKSAEIILEQTEKPDLKCWNSILTGYAHHGKADEAFGIFNEIVNLGLIPDEITYLSMLAACNHCGLVDKGKLIWTSMNENGLIPGVKHYSCFVNLLSRAGLLEEAEKMIMGSDSNLAEMNGEMWRMLLSSCVNKRNVEVGSRVADRIVNMNMEDGAVYVLLTKVYALTGRWEDVAKIRRKIREVDEKDPGLSWVELGRKRNVFASGDKSQPEVDEMETELLGLQKNLVKPEDDSIRLYV